jgi:hypothetical protein
MAQSNEAQITDQGMTTIVSAARSIEFKNINLVKAVEELEIHRKGLKAKEDRVSDIKAEIAELESRIRSAAKTL